MGFELFFLHNITVSGNSGDCFSLWVPSEHKTGSKGKLLVMEKIRPEFPLTHMGWTQVSHILARVVSPALFVFYWENGTSFGEGMKDETVTKLTSDQPLLWRRTIWTDSLPVFCEELGSFRKQEAHSQHLLDQAPLGSQVENMSWWVLVVI